jgi:hypothetical protein
VNVPSVRIDQAIVYTSDARDGSPNVDNARTGHTSTIACSERFLCGISVKIHLIYLK